MEALNPDQIAQSLINSMGSYCDTTGICRQILHLLTKGQPVAVDEIATSLQLSRDAVVSVLRQFPDVQYDDEGRVIGKGLTLSPTPHHFFVNGHTLYTWCALDTLMYPTLLKQAARVESPCAITGAPITLMALPDGVKNVTPKGIAVSVVVPEQKDVSCNVRTAFCNHVNFFSSAEVASTWLVKHPTAIILSINDAFQVGRILAANLYQK